MSVAALELCRELYKLSDWTGTDKVWSHRVFGGRAGTMTLSPDGKYRPRKYTAMKWVVAHTDSKQKEVVPAYSIDYVIRKLPRIGVKLQNYTTGWVAQWNGEGTRNFEHSVSGDTLEDAVVRLAIELLRQGVLERQV